VKLALLVHQISNRTGDELLCTLTDGGKAESGEVKEKELATVARQQKIGDGGERVVDHQWRVGTSHLAGHGRTEPKTQILQLGGEAIILDGRTTSHVHTPLGV
jgi:hypothetical protein